MSKRKETSGKYRALTHERGESMKMLSSTLSDLKKHIYNAETLVTHAESVGAGQSKDVAIIRQHIYAMRRSRQQLKVLKRYWREVDAAVIDAIER